MIYDVIVVGGGAAGLMCATVAGHRGRKVLLIDHEKIGAKILISGGGRCNFTNTESSPHHYVSHNPHFCKSALSRYRPRDFISLVEKYKIEFYEKKLGQLFCKNSAQDILNIFARECIETHVEIKTKCKVNNIVKNENAFNLTTSEDNFTCSSLVIATGGLSIPKLGATSFGYDMARQFGLNVVETRPALDGFLLNSFEVNFFSKLSGVSIDCVVTCHDKKFRENILFTHRGLSGPAVLQASLYWNKGNVVEINLLPNLGSLYPNAYELFLQRKKMGSRTKIRNVLAELLPSRFVECFCAQYFPQDKPINEIKDKELEDLANLLHAWKLTPTDTVGYNKAEVTRGGVDTNELSSQTMESKKVKGLYFIGEVVDVTGELGGYNFQWAWASGWAAGQVV
ncbi:MAG TPA: NAD(P)/FAD-dependent oxidoreductase [Bdellovibrionota bacterium]|nr:NAD(P)/FAD-dependent oxidoreductase [Bdellovibrionota bacterium]